MDLLDVYAKMYLDKKDYENGLKDAEKDAENSSSNIGTKLKSLASGVGKGIAVTAKVVGAGMAAATTAAGALVKQSVSAYAEYQQLWGGVQKLYGAAGQSLEEYAESTGRTIEEAKADYESLKQAETMMLNQANEAYKNAGMSANQYMETATQFSAALISSLGGDTVEAARLTNVAMQSIADNYNTFGGDMESITNAFKGFAKQNYTMLDNLNTMGALVV